MTISFFTAQSGIRSGRAVVDAAAHNLANVNTRGFRPLRSESVETAPYGVKTQITRDSSPGPLYPDPAKEIINLMIGENELKINCTVIKSEDSMLGSLLDILA